MPSSSRERGSSNNRDRIFSPLSRSKSLQSSPTVHERVFPQAAPVSQRPSGQLQEFERTPKVWTPPARSFSVDAGTKRIPIAVHHVGPSVPSTSSDVTQQRARRYSEEDHSFVSGVGPGPSQLSSSWQNSHDGYFPFEDNRGRDLAPGSYATLPSKGSRQRAQRETFDQSDAIKPDFDYPNTYSTLPTIKPLKSSSIQQPFSEANPSDDSHHIKTSQSFDFGQHRRDLEHTLDYKDYSKPLYADTNFGSLRQSSTSSQEDGHSPHSDNAVSSSDSRDTIIAKDEKSPADSVPVDMPTEMRSEGKPAVAAKPAVSPKPTQHVKMIPITVVHEQPSQPVSSSHLHDSSFLQRLRGNACLQGTA